MFSRGSSTVARTHRCGGRDRGGGRGFAFGEDPAVMISSVIPPGNGMCMNVAASIALVPDHLTTGGTDV